MTIHASCVAFGEKAVLIRGPSGSGKSDLVLRLIDTAGRGIGQFPVKAKLVADDQVHLQLANAAIYASPPEVLAGKLEIRGQGIVNLEFVRNIKLALIVDLVELSHLDRLPEPHQLETELMGIRLPLLKLYGPAASAPARIRAFLG